MRRYSDLPFPVGLLLASIFSLRTCFHIEFHTLHDVGYELTIVQLTGTLLFSRRLLHSL